MADGHETELKLLFAPEDLPRIMALPALKDAAPQDRQHLFARYFDTPDDCLWRQGLSLRIRKSERGRIQTLKQESSSSIDRGEWEKEIAEDVPDLDALAETPPGSDLAGALDGLEPRFEVEVERVSADLELDHARIEASIDKGVIKAQGATSPVNELELELKDGDSSVLFDLARTCARQAPLRLSLISKAERGYLLDEREQGRSHKADRPVLTADMNCAAAIEAICRSCLHAFMLNMEALETFDRVEAVHQARVSLRRLRAGLQLFKPVVCDDRFQPLDDEFKWMAHLLGEARDLDVFQEATFLPAARERAILGAGELADHVEAKRSAAHKAVDNAVKSERGRLLLIEMIEWIERGDWRRANFDKTQEAAPAFTGAALRKKRKRLVRQGAGLRSLDADKLHKVRIGAKKLRYMVDFFKNVPETAANPKAVKPLLKSLEELQLSLGLLHDEDAKADFLANEVRELPENADPVIAFAAGVIAGAPRDPGRQLDVAVNAYSSLKKAKPY